MQGNWSDLATDIDIFVSRYKPKHGAHEVQGFRRFHRADSEQHPKASKWYWYAKKHDPNRYIVLVSDELAMQAPDILACLPWGFFRVGHIDVTVYGIT